MKTVRKIAKCQKDSVFSMGATGQGVVEYILVVMVGVLIALGGIYQLNDAFRSWAQSYFGDYLTCLLETGELPTIGGSGGVSGLCNQEFAEFSLANGRPLIGDPIGSGSGAGEGGGGDDEASGRGDSNGVNAEAGPGGGGAAGRTGGSFGSRRFAVNRGGANQSGSNNASKDSETGGDGVLNIGQTGNEARVTRIPLRDAQGIRGGASRKQAEEEEKARTKVSISAEEKANRRQLIKLGRGPAKESLIEEEEPMTIGNFLRYLIIAGILIALLVLLGGQALQIGKSMEGQR